MAGVSKEALLSHLQDLGIHLCLHEHPVVMRVEEMSTHLRHLKTIPSKNLLLKDKKGRFYLISAYANTIVDLKALSQRLGLGKNGLRMAPEDALQEVLKVELGSVTPLALINPSARSVILLLDHRYQNQSKLLFHPLVNTSTLELTNADLIAFLQSIDRIPSYVDFEATVAVGKDQPPDLAAYATASTIKPMAPDLAAKFETPDNKQAMDVIQSVSLANGGVANRTMPSTKSKVSNNERPDEEKALEKLVGDPQKLVNHILQTTISATLKKVTNDSRDKERDLSTENDIKNEIGPDLESIIILLKNTAYTQGFVAGRSR